MNASLLSANFQIRFTFKADNFAENTFCIVRFEGEEGLGELYRFELLLASTDNDIDEQKLLGRQAVFRLNEGEETGRESNHAVYCGLVTAFEQLQQISGWTFYRAVLEPRLWQLGSFHLTEVYLNKTMRELLETLLAAGGLSRKDYNLSFLQSAGYPMQPFTCQFKENYLVFLSRWCEYLGVYWWFAPSETGEQVVFGNHLRNHPEQSIGMVYIPAGEPEGVEGKLRRVHSFKLFSQPLPKQVTVTNYFYQKAALQISASSIVNAQGVGEVRYYGMYADNNELAQQLADIRAEALICRARQFSGESTSTGLRCGYLFNLSNHYRPSFNQRYLLTRIAHRGSQAGLLLDGLGIQLPDNEPTDTFYLADFSAIPSDIQFRPAHRHPWPKIDGTLHAFIDAEGSGKYAELNENGEYKVQLPYDLTEKNAAKASAQIRMATPYAGVDDTGATHGMHFPLHKGTEVLLSFHDGNPDKPVIIGAVTNSATPSVVNNENQTRAILQTAGQNSLEFHDIEGQQGIHLFSPTANTRMSLGARSPTANGLHIETIGSFSYTCNNSLSNNSGSSISNTLGASTTNVTGATTGIYEGAYTALYGGLYNEVFLGGKTSTHIAAILELSLSTKLEIGIANSTHLHLGGKLKFVSSETAFKENVNEVVANQFKVVENDIKAVQNDIKTAEVAIITAQNDIKTVENEIKASQNDIKAVENDIKTVEASVEMTNARIFNVETDVSSIMSAVRETGIEVQSGTKILMP
ncbi:type VI secretion system tip protein TssI/VgrG [Candidatus Methylospira mobilis]|uniref:type VI secretion system Vgr family protein n=1 Tax=Candidatus Methylospira mobilis TaxID=1808979 RepID=UPI0028E66CED|nr:type VI secretion system tip protein TssI/VgrG [Candidatus Methylospira mobilis]WNV04364.1 type VI secretion system tip protein TssI/VgrG [Candidatus Methylospira mobilis]